MKVAVIGGGTMGEAIVKSLLRNKLAGKQDIVVGDIAGSRLETLHKRYGINITSDNVDGVKDVQVVILAIKPQELMPVLDQISKHINKQLVISIAAGISLDLIRQKLDSQQIVRAMPNTPAQVGKGMTVWVNTDGLNKENYETAQKILAAMGEEIHFTNEKYIDMATAISGSGPAYVFYFIEALIDAGVHIGLPRDIAQKLVIQTIVGSVETMKKMSKHPAELKNMVTSPGGTTSEALLQLESGGMKSQLINAVLAAYTKAGKMGTK